MGWLDLHLHSNYSLDGEYSPRELMALCRRSGVRTAALADHNTTRGVAQAQEWAAREGLTLIPAVELDCTFQDVNLHLLGVWIDPDAAGFAQVEQEILEQERAASHERICRIKALDIVLEDSDLHRLARAGILTGEMLAEAALTAEKNQNHPLLLPYRSGGERAENPLVNFYWDFCAQGKPAEVPLFYPTLSQTIALIYSAGGIPVLAHPANNLRENAALLAEIVRQGVCGLEVYSSYQTPAQTAFYREQALSFGLAMSCGSDFHGKTKPSIAIGAADCGGREAELLAGLEEKQREGRLA